MYSGINTEGKEEEVGNKFSFVLGAKIQGEPLELPMDKQTFQKISPGSYGSAWIF